MTTRYKALAFALAASVPVSASLAAQQARIANGTVTSQPAGVPFAASFRALVSSQADVAWIGYSVPVVDGERTMCCFNSGTTFVNGSTSAGCCGLCALENTRAPIVNAAPASPAPPSAIKLEASARMIVLFRVAARSIERVRVFSEDCQLDAGGRPVQWIDGVRPADSVALLESLALSTVSTDRVVDGALTAIALHADDAADVSLERLVIPPQPDSLRKKVTFWLGNARGRRGFDALRRVMREDPSVGVRKGAIFGLSQSRVPEAFDILIGIARTDTQPALRGEALFWLAQQAGRTIAATIAERVDQDPDTDVKKKAVFALGQLPTAEGVPLLIDVARTNKNIEVRKQAMFWLGQSKDPRAVDFFSEVLRK